MFVVVAPIDRLRVGLVGVVFNFPAVAFGAEGYGICSRLLTTVGQGPPICLPIQSFGAAEEEVLSLIDNPKLTFRPLLSAFTIHSHSPLPTVAANRMG